MQETTWNKYLELFTLSFYPESFSSVAKAGLLTYSLSDQPSHPAPAEQWHEVEQKDANELTAAGTVRDFHPVPYYDSVPEGSKYTLAVAKVHKY